MTNHFTRCVCLAVLVGCAAEPVSSTSQEVMDPGDEILNFLIGKDSQLGALAQEQLALINEIKALKAAGATAAQKQALLAKISSWAGRVTALTKSVVVPQAARTSATYANYLAYGTYLEAIAKKLAPNALKAMGFLGVPLAVVDAWIGSGAGSANAAEWVPCYSGGTCSPKAAAGYVVSAVAGWDGVKNGMIAQGVSLTGVNADGTLPGPYLDVFNTMNATEDFFVATRNANYYFGDPSLSFVGALDHMQSLYDTEMQGVGGLWIYTAPAPQWSCTCLGWYATANQMVDVCSDPEGFDDDTDTSPNSGNPPCSVVLQYPSLFAGFNAYMTAAMNGTPCEGYDPDGSWTHGIAHCTLQ